MPAAAPGPATTFAAFTASVKLAAASTVRVANPIIAVLRRVNALMTPPTTSDNFESVPRNRSLTEPIIAPSVGLTIDANETATPENALFTDSADCVMPVKAFSRLLPAP